MNTSIFASAKSFSPPSALSKLLLFVVTKNWEANRLQKLIDRVCCSKLTNRFIGVKRSISPTNNLSNKQFI